MRLRDFDRTAGDQSGGKKEELITFFVFSLCHLLLISWFIWREPEGYHGAAQQSIAQSRRAYHLVREG